MYDTRIYEVLFDQVNVVPLAEQLKGIWCQRTRTITSGPIVECISFPVLTARPKAARDELKKSREAQKNLNEKNAKLTLDRKINASFGPGDLLISLTFPAGHQPVNDDAALAEAQKYIRRLRSYRKRRVTACLKYVYIIERTESSRYGTRYHYHMVMSGDGMDRDEVEALWYEYTKGTANTRRYQKQAGHFTGWSRYMNKFKSNQAKAMSRRWNCSKNLSDPKVTESDHKISRHQVEKIAGGIAEDAGQVFAKQYPGCELLEYEVRTSQFVQGVYIYAKMRKQEDKYDTRKAGGKANGGNGNTRNRAPNRKMHE